MPLSPKQVIEFLDAHLAEYARLDAGSANDVMLARRAWQVQRIRSFLERNGFPATAEERCELSLIPHIFQEANYDGIDWGERDADLRHLAYLFALDFYVATRGMTRREAVESVFLQYNDESLKCIDAWKSS